LETLRNNAKHQQREQFPALHTPRGHGTEWAGITSGKILNAKRATQSSSKNASRAVWDRVEAAAGSSAAANRMRATAGTNGRHVPGASGAASSGSFPALGGPSSGPTKSSTHSTPWASGGAGSSSKAPTALAGPIIRSVNYPTPAAASKPKALSSAGFPGLPASSGKGMTKEERQALFNKPNAREESIRRITGAGPPPPLIHNGWGGATSPSDVVNGVQEMNLGGEAQESTGAAAGGGGRKKGKGKQLLFSVSARP